MVVPRLTKKTDCIDHLEGGGPSIGVEFPADPAIFHKPFIQTNFQQFIDCFSLAVGMQIFCHFELPPKALV